MTAFLVVASLTVPIVDTGAQRAANEMGGSDSRAYAGNLRSTRRWQKRVWKMTTAFLAETDAETLESAIALGKAVVISGNAIGAGVAAIATPIDSPQYTNVDGGTGLGFMRQVSMTIREV